MNVPINLYLPRVESREKLMRSFGKRESSGSCSGGGFGETNSDGRSLVKTPLMMNDKYFTSPMTSSYSTMPPTSPIRSKMKHSLIDSSINNQEMTEKELSSNSSSRKG